MRVVKRPWAGRLLGLRRRNAVCLQFGSMCPGPRPGLVCHLCSSPCRVPGSTYGLPGYTFTLEADVGARGPPLFYRLLSPQGPGAIPTPLRSNFFQKAREAAYASKGHCRLGQRSAHEPRSSTPFRRRTQPVALNVEFPVAHVCQCLSFDSLNIKAVPLEKQGKHCAVHLQFQLLGHGKP